MVNSSGSTINFGSTTAISFTGGEATVSSGRNGVMRLYAAEAAHITVGDNAISNGSGLAVTVGMSSLTISVTTPGTQTAGTAFNLAITAKDTFGNAASGPLPVTFSGPESSPSEKAPGYPGTVTFTAGSGTAPVTLYAAGTTTVAVKQGSAEGKTGTFTVSPAGAAKLAWTNASSFFGEAEGLCLFTCTWLSLGKGHAWTAKISVTDSYGNVVSNIGSGHTVIWTGGPNVGSLNPSSLSLPSSGAATTSSSVTYNSSNGNSWSSDTFSAHSSPYGDATVLFKK